MKKQLQGEVVSLKMQNTAVVSVERKTAHPLYKKIVRQTKKYKAHMTPDMKLAVGDTVTIEETRPLSRDKHFKVVTKTQG
jgi:small subunit ribosomal protein S17